MKNIRKYIILLSAICLGLSSCVKEEPTGTERESSTTFRVSWSDTKTKTILDDHTPMWTPEDSIIIFDGENNIFRNSLSAPSATAEFKGTLAGKGRQHYLAVCPYDPDITFYMLGKTIYGLEIPSEQKATQGTYDPNAMVSMAYADDKNLSFKNLCTLVKFAIEEDGVESVTLKSHDGVSLSGDFFAAYDEPIRISVKEGKDNVTLNGNFIKGETYYLTTLPAEMSNGFSVILNETETVKEYKAPVVFNRSGLVNIGELAFDQDQTPETPGDDSAGGVVYLSPGPWDTDGAWFEVWSWPTGSEGSWYQMESVSAGVFKCTIPSENSNVIFVRRGPDMVSGWEQGVHYWNKTDDLAIPSGKNHYTITGWGGSDGEWSTLNQ